MLARERVLVQDIDNDILFFKIGLDPMEIFKVIVDFLEPAHVLHQLAVLGPGPAVLQGQPEIFCCGFFLSGC